MYFKCFIEVIISLFIYSLPKNWKYQQNIILVYKEASFSVLNGDKILPLKINSLVFYFHLLLYQHFKHNGIFDILFMSKIIFYHPYFLLALKKWNRWWNKKLKKKWNCQWNIIFIGDLIDEFSIFLCCLFFNFLTQ